MSVQLPRFTTAVLAASLVSLPACDRSTADPLDPAARELAPAVDLIGEPDLSAIADFRDRVIPALEIDERAPLLSAMDVVDEALRTQRRSAVASAVAALRQVAARTLAPAELSTLDLAIADLADQLQRASSTPY
jgi:hypothetical protein